MVFGGQVLMREDNEWQASKHGNFSWLACCLHAQYPLFFQTTIFLPLSTIQFPLFPYDFNG